MRAFLQALGDTLLWRQFTSFIVLQKGIHVDMAFCLTDSDALPLIYDLMQNEGLYLGGSTAINVAGAVAMAREMGPGHRIATILCDSGQRYQSKVWNPEFLRSKNLPVPSWL